MNNMLEYFVTARDMTDKGLRQVRQRFIDTTRKIANDTQRSLGFGNIEQSLIRGVFGGNLLMQGARMATNFAKEILFASDAAKELGENIKKAIAEFAKPVTNWISDRAEAWSLILTGKLPKSVTDHVKLTSDEQRKAAFAENYPGIFKTEYETESKERRRKELMDKIVEARWKYYQLETKMKTQTGAYDINKLNRQRVDLLRLELNVAQELGSTWDMVSEKVWEYNKLLNDVGGGMLITQEIWERDKIYAEALEKEQARLLKEKQDAERKAAKDKQKALKDELDNYKKISKQIENNLDIELDRIDALKEQKQEQAEQLRDESARLKYLALNKGALRAEQRAQREAQKEDRRYQSILANVQRKLNANARRHGRFGIPLSDTEKAALGSERARAEATRLEAQAQELDRNSKQAQIDAANALARIETAVDKLVNEAVEGD